MRTVYRPLVPRMEDGLRLLFRRIPSSFVFAVLTMTFFAFDLSSQGNGVSCYQRVNVSINSGTPTRLRISQLSPRPINEGDTVILQDRTELVFTCDDVGQIITAILMDAAGEMCSVDIHVENKSPLEITCRDTLINCIDNIMSVPPESLIDVVSSCDNLVGALITSSDEEPVDFPPTSDTLQSIIRQFTVVGSNGDTARCNSQIYIERFDLNSIVFPGDTMIFCGSDPADTSITGGLNINIDMLGALCNVAVAVGDINERDKGSCQNPRVYERLWAVTDWDTDETRSTTQLISVLDTNTYQIEAPSTFEMIPMGCEVGVVIDTGSITTMCLEFGQDDIEVLLAGGIHEVGDTVLVEPGTFSVTYRPRSGCANVASDTESIVVSDTGLSAPILDCSSIGPKCIALVDGVATSVGIDTLCSGAVIEACDDVVLRARKVDVTCTSDTQEFTDILEFCPDELLSGQSPGTIMIEVIAVQDETLVSNICTIEVQVKEEVPPMLDVIEDPFITLGPDGTFALDTSDIVNMLFDNSDCILSLSMTGSGTGFVNTMISPTGSGATFANALALTGSGFPFFADGDFHTFSCPDTGTYDVIVMAEDCDNNLVVDQTSLTVLPGAGCDDDMMSGLITGSITTGYGDALSNISVEFSSANAEVSTITSEEGVFSFSNITDKGEVGIRLDDNWKKGISVIDLKLLQSYIVGLIDLEEWQKAAADVDGSGSITSKDLLLAKLILLDRDVSRRADEMPWLFSIGEGMHTYAEYLRVPAVSSDRISVSASKKGDINGDAIILATSRSNRSIPISIERLDENHTAYTLEGSEDLFQLSINIQGATLMSTSHAGEFVFDMDNDLDIIKYDWDDEPISFVLRHHNGVRPTIRLGDRLEPIAYSLSGHKSSLSLRLQGEDLPLTDEVFLLQAYPNPSDRDVWVDVVSTDQGASDIDITITDIQGRLIDHKEWRASKISDLFPYRLPELPHTGVYITHVRYNNRTKSLYIVKK